MLPPASRNRPARCNDGGIERFLSGGLFQIRRLVSERRARRSRVASAYHDVASGPYVYRAEYVPPGKPSQATQFRSETPLEPGQWLTVEGAFLVVERIVSGKRGDPYAGIAISHDPEHCPGDTWH
jgi:hypothetical protein